VVSNIYIDSAVEEFVRTEELRRCTVRVSLCVILSASASLMDDIDAYSSDLIRDM